MLVELDGSDDLVTRGLHVRAVRSKDREADFIASTDDVDRYDEIIDQSSWQLDDFIANPVVLFAHNSRDLPIGQVTKIAVVENRLECTIRFLDADANPMAERVWRCVEQKALRAVSVGFMPHEYRWEKRDNKEVLVLLKNELREISVVPIPGNANALAKMKAARAAETKTAAPMVLPTQQTTSKGAKMTLEEALTKINELQSAQHDRDAKIRSLEADVRAGEVLKVKLSTLETQNERLVTERDAAVKERDAATSELTEKMVGDLVGKKISTAEKDAFVELAKKDRPLFEKMIAQRSDLKLTEQKLGDAPKPLEKSVGGPDDLSDLLAEVLPS